MYKRQSDTHCDRRTLGTITDNINKDLHTLKLQKQQDALQMIVATGTVNILNNHFRRDDFQ